MKVLCSGCQLQGKCSPEVQEMEKKEVEKLTMEQVKERMSHLSHVDKLAKRFQVVFSELEEEGESFKEIVQSILWLLIERGWQAGQDFDVKKMVQIYSTIYSAEQVMKNLIAATMIKREQRTGS